MQLLNFLLIMQYKFAQWLLEDFDLNGETVMVAPAAGFYSTPNTGANQVRIAYVLKQKLFTKRN